MTESEKKLRITLEKLADDLQEKRSDISDILYRLLDTDDYSPNYIYNPDHIEHRMSVFEVPLAEAKIKDGKITVQYDTLTTELAYVQNNNLLSEPIGAVEYYD